MCCWCALLGSRSAGATCTGYIGFAAVVTQKAMVVSQESLGKDLEACNERKKERVWELSVTCRYIEEG